MAHWCLLQPVRIVTLLQSTRVLSSFLFKEVCRWCVFRIVELDRSLGMSAELEKQAVVRR